MVNEALRQFNINLLSDIMLLQTQDKLLNRVSRKRQLRSIDDSLLDEIRRYL